MKSMSIHTELQFEPITQPLDFNDFISDTTKAIKIGNRRAMEYTDHYYDSHGLELHDNGLLLRSRSRNDKTDFLDFKGTGFYVGVLVGRNFASDLINSEQELLDKLNLRKSSISIQSLYYTRPDLLGRGIIETARVKVSKVSFDMLDENGHIFAVISLHQYYFIFNDATRKRKHYLIELQPKRNKISNEISSTAIDMEKAASLILSAGFYISPSTKYHRIPRDKLNDGRK